MERLHLKLSQETRKINFNHIFYLTQSFQNIISTCNILKIVPRSFIALFPLHCLKNPVCILCSGAVISKAQSPHVAGGPCWVL